MVKFYSNPFREIYQKTSQWMELIKGTSGESSLTPTGPAALRRHELIHQFNQVQPTIDASPQPRDWITIGALEPEISNDMFSQSKGRNNRHKSQVCVCTTRNRVFTPLAWNNCTRMRMDADATVMVICADSPRSVQRLPRLHSPDRYVTSGHLGFGQRLGYWMLASSSGVRKVQWQSEWARLSHRRQLDTEYTWVWCGQLPASWPLERACITPARRCSIMHS
ncbi:hypothetical protein J6590_002063 [Homalodisca vitripennis]|nr:hypothetical protein J6590_002063 [Homalodisca vitripennis]